MSIQLNQDAPNFEADAVIGGGDFTRVSLKKLAEEGKWTVLYFYPFDWTGVCLSEIAAFDNKRAEFEAAGAQLVAVSCDTKFSHKEWILSGKLVESKKVGHPIVADNARNISKDYGVYDDGLAASMRGTFIIDPKGKIRWYTVNPPLVGRNTSEILRTLKGLQRVDTEGMAGACLVDWQPK